MDSFSCPQGSNNAEQTNNSTKNSNQSGATNDIIMDAKTAALARRRKRCCSESDSRIHWATPSPSISQLKKAVETLCDQPKQRRKRKRRNRQPEKSNVPRAPENTTQFLMADHELESGTGMKIDNTPTSAATGGGMALLSSADYGSSDCSSGIEEQDDELHERFYEEDFKKTWSQVHSDELYTLPKPTLIKAYMNMEDKLTDKLAFMELELKRSQVALQTSVSKNDALKRANSELIKKCQQFELRNSELSITLGQQLMKSPPHRSPHHAAVSPSHRSPHHPVSPSSHRSTPPHRYQLRESPRSSPPKQPSSPAYQYSPTTEYSPARKTSASSPI